MAISTEQEFIDLFYPDDDTKNVHDVIENLRVLQRGVYTTEQVQNQIKSDLSDVSDWSF